LPGLGSSAVAGQAVAVAPPVLARGHRSGRGRLAAGRPPGGGAAPAPRRAWAHRLVWSLL